MMYMLKLLKPELVEKRDSSITLRSDENIAFARKNLEFWSAQMKLLYIFWCCIYYSVLYIIR